MPRSSSPPISDSSDAADGTPCSVASLGNWFRAEIPSQSTPPEAARPPVRIPPHLQVLVAGGTMAPQARIHIVAGKLAGSQIQLTATGGRIEAHLLTANATSRQTLAVALEAVREKLRGRLVRGVAASAEIRHALGDGRAPARRGSAEADKGNSSTGSG